jgi:hypothetical protein
VTVVWDNESELLHSFCLEGPQGKGVNPPRGGVSSSPVKATSSMSGNIASVYDNLKPCKYTFYCGVDGHRAQGMEGTLTVESAFSAFSNAASRRTARSGWRFLLAYPKNGANNRRPTRGG